MELHLGYSSIRNGRGGAIRSSGSVTWTNVEIAGNTLPADSTITSLVSAEASAPGMFIRDVVFFGNLVESGDGERALLAGPIHGMRNAAFVANGLGEDEALLRTGFRQWMHEPGSEIDPGIVVGVVDSVFSRNRFVSPSDDFVLPPLPMSDFVPTEDSTSETPRCLGEPANTTLDQLPSPFDGLPSASGSLIVFDPAYGYPANGGALVARTFIVDNEIGDRPLVRARLAPGLSLQLLHDTIAGNGAGTVVQLDTAGDNTGLVLLRNLLLGGAGDTVPVVLEQEVGSLTVSMNASDGRAWSEGLSASTASLLGPNLVVDDPGFVDPAGFRLMDGCTRHRALCPGVEIEDCETWPNQLGALQCAPDRAAMWLPDEETSEALAWGWPWGTDFFPQDLESADVPGATGWLCAVARASLDGGGPDGGPGDGDGYPDAVDCDNDDPDVIPLLPDLNGVDTEDCDPVGGNCWICPDGTAIDDDDSGSPPDDDDSAPLPDDDDSTPADDDDYAPIPPTCQGCGFSWSCSDGVTSAVLIFPLLLLPTRRRRAA